MTRERELPDSVRAAFEEFKAAWHGIDAFCERHPECGPELRAEVEGFLYLVEGLGEGRERARQHQEIDASSKGAGAPSTRSPRANGEGETFGRFRLLKLLGQGGMGTVHLALDEKLEREVAVKQIRPEYLDSPEARTRFEREARAVSRLDHPNLCQVYETGVDDGVPYLVVQYVEGETLSARLQHVRKGEGPLLPGSGGRRGDTTGSTSTTAAGVAGVIAMFEKVARALHHAHENGLVHRDVKPGNIMVRGDGEPVILDFGLVRDEERPEQTLTEPGRWIGTPPYMSPEQIAGRSVDRRTDVYSLGVALYECLTLAHPFEAPTQHELFEKILREPPQDARKLNRQIPRDLQVVLETALEKERSRRFATALDFAEDLRRVREHEPIRARRAGLVLRAWRWCQRHRAAALALLALGLGVVGTGVFAWKAAVHAERAEANLVNFNRMRQVVELEDARAEMARLQPAWPATIPGLEAWLARYGEPLPAALPELRSAVAELPAGFLCATLSELADDIEAFEREDVADVRRRLAWARRVEELTVHRYRERWGQVREDLRPQLGLVPIGVNPVTGLWEFYHLRSAWDPESGVDPADLPIPAIEDYDALGNPALESDAGIVFALLPAGAFTMGAGLASDHDAEPDEGPPHEVALSAFFLARHELTQGQWRRLSGREDGSYYRIGTPDYRGGLVSPSHPVEQVDWFLCRDVLAQHGLELPTEAQWEYGCRAGRDTALLECVANTEGVVPGDGDSGLPRDVFAIHAPVGSLGANAFGLYDMHGNVWEWCRDWFGSYDLPVTPGEGERQVEGAWMRVRRGGSYLYDPRLARATYRDANAPSIRARDLGARAARRVR